MSGTRLFRAAEQSLQQAGGFFAEPAGGGTVGFLCGTDLAGHQISTEKAHGKHKAFCYELEPEETLDMVNRLLNPYVRELTPEDLNLVQADSYMW